MWTKTLHGAALTVALVVAVGASPVSVEVEGTGEPATPLEVGLLMYESGRLAEALMAFGQAAEADPASPMPDFGVAITCAAFGWLDRAEEALHAALGKRPEFPEAHDELADVLLRRRAFADAESHYRTAIAQRPGFVEAHLGLGLAFATQRRFAEARVAYERALELAPATPDGHRSLGEIHAWEGDLDAAIASYEKALSLDGSDIAARHGLGLARLRRRDYAAAISSLERVVGLDPRHKSGWHSLAKAYAAAGQIADADAATAKFAALHELDEKLKPHLRTLEADPANLPARYSIMKEYLRAKRPLDAIRECDRMLAIDRTFVPALDALVRIHLSRKEWGPGVVWAGHLTRASPDTPMGFLYLGMAAGAVGEVDDAVAAYRRAIELDPNAPAGYNNLAWMLQRHGGSLDEAATLAERAVGIEPKPRYLDTLSRVYEAQGRADDALHAITRALEADPDNAAYRSRADALREAGAGGKR